MRDSHFLSLMLRAVSTYCEKMAPIEAHSMEVDVPSIAAPASAAD
jgi:hypothetical protein